jgi:hypothetical protein
LIHCKAEQEQVVEVPANVALVNETSCDGVQWEVAPLQTVWNCMHESLHDRAVEAKRYDLFAVGLRFMNANARRFVGRDDRRAPRWMARQGREWWMCGVDIVRDITMTACMMPCVGVMCCNVWNNVLLHVHVRRRPGRPIRRHLEYENFKLRRVEYIFKSLARAC